MIISYDVTAECKEPADSEPDEDDTSNLRDEDFPKDETIHYKADDGSVDPQLEEIDAHV